MPDRNLIGGGRLTRAEQSGDRRDLSGAQKPKKLAVLRRLWRYLGRNRGLVVLALCLAVGGNLLALLGPLLSGRAINAIGDRPGGVQFGPVFFNAALMAICYTASAVFSYLLARVMNRLSRRVAYQMRRDVFARLSVLPVGFFDRNQAGDLISVLTYDVDTVNQSLSNDLLQIVQSVLTVGVSLGMMLWIEPRLVLIFAVTIPLSVFFTKYLTGRVRPLFRRRSALLGELNGFVEEMIDGQKTTRAYHREQAVIDRFDAKNAAAVDAYTKSEYYGTITGPSVNFINNISLALVSMFGAWMYLRRAISLGDISAFVQYSRKFSGPINEIANITGELQSAFAAAERVFRLLDEPAEPADAADATTLTDVRGEVALRDVCFGYTPDRPVIRHFDLHAPPGSLIAIVGPTGAGKTTVINLLMRFYDVDSGSITVDGQDVYHVTRDSLRGAYTMVLQDTWLFSGTIYENIAYGRADATRETVEAAAKAAHIHSFIEALPDGYQTRLTDNAVNLSKGQKQLLTIARAMLLDANMLILDEATSNVDTRTEQQIQAAMRDLMRDKTCFVIAHRLSTVQGADRILVVRDGQIVEQGTHRALLAQNGFYASLYAAQFDAGEDESPAEM